MTSIGSTLGVTIRSLVFHLLLDFSLGCIVCVYQCFYLCVVRVMSIALAPVQGVLPFVCHLKEYGFGLASWMP